MNTIKGRADCGHLSTPASYIFVGWSPVRGHSNSTFAPIWHFLTPLPPLVRFLNRKNFKLSMDCSFLADPFPLPGRTYYLNDPWCNMKFRSCIQSNMMFVLRIAKKVLHGVSRKRCVVRSLITHVPSWFQLRQFFENIDQMHRRKPSSNQII